MPQTEDSEIYFDTLQQAAEEASKHFTRKKRDDKTIVVLKDDAPQWLKDLARKAHGEMLPDDFRYSVIEEAMDRFPGYDDPDTAIAEIEADVYTSDLLDWLNSHGERPAYVDEATSEFGHHEGGVVGDIGMGQYMEKREVYEIIRQQLEEMVI